MNIWNQAIASKPLLNVSQFEVRMLNVQLISLAISVFWNSFLKGKSHDIEHKSS